MKKFLCLFLAVLMALALVACGEEPAATDTATGANSQSTSGDTSSDTTQKRTLKMVTNASFQPYEYYDADNNIIGIDAEIAKAIADKLGCDLVINDMAFNSLLNAVESGSADFVMAGLTVREDRKEHVNFSNTYATGKQVVIVKDGGAVKTIDDLTGKKIGVQIATTGDIYATGDYGTNEDGTLNGNVVEYNNGNEAVLALIGGAVDAVIIDNEPAKSLVKANEGKGLSILETEYVYEEYALGVNKNDTELLKQINAAIDALTADGTIAKIVAKYIPAE